MPARRGGGVHRGSPEGYQTLLGDWGYSLSAGQRQKLALARVLLKDPDLVVLDEATAHLDGPAEKEVLAAFETVLAGRTVVTISHELRSVVGRTASRCSAPARSSSSAPTLS